MIRLLIVDDQSIVREGLKSLLQAQPDLEVVGMAEQGQIALEQAIALRPDVVLMDIRMPIMDGVAATEAIQSQAPAIKILVLTTFDDDESVSRAIRAGAKGYLLKDTPSDELAEAIRAVQRGYSHLGPGLLDKMMAHAEPPTPKPPPELAQLTPRELEVLALLGEGYSNREIAKALYISERTVKNHVTHVLGRLQLRDRTQAALFAAQFLR
ncbi:response regulator [Spirulina major]|uniref:response regulator n=1 Tax=Spirulina major TaxID=270636 RepID=UPI0009323DE0|nr:response regulator transcription factor [Spirulina major]